MNKQTAAGINIAGFIILLISLLIPIYGLYIGGIALILVTLGAAYGERLFALITVIVSAVKVWFLSPSFSLLVSELSDDRALYIVIALAAHAAPVIAMVVSAQRAGGTSTGTSEETRT